MESLIAISSIATIANFLQELKPTSPFSEPVNGPSSPQPPTFNRPPVRFDWKSPLNFQSESVHRGQEWFGNGMKLY